MNGGYYELDSKDIIDAAKNIPMPESGSKYEATTAAFEELPVAKIGESDSGIVYDCGENTTGYPVLKIKAKKGEKIF